MRSSFLDRWGPLLAFSLLTLFVWRLIAFRVHEMPEFELLFPLHWLEMSPLHPLLRPWLLRLGQETWWPVAEILITVGVWTLIFFIVRGIFYKVASMEGPSMWVVFGLCITLALLGFSLLVSPAFRQMNVWWSAWPGVHAPLFPGVGE